MTRIGHNHGSIEGPGSSRFGRCLNRNDVIDFLPGTNNQIAQRVRIEGWGNCRKKSYRIKFKININIKKESKIDYSRKRGFATIGEEASDGSPGPALFTAITLNSYS